MRPGIERESDENVGVGQVMLERETINRRKRLPVAVQMSHEAFFAIASHAVAQDVIVHAPTDVDWIDLHEAEVAQDGGDFRRGLIEEHGAPVETPGQNGWNFKRSRQHRAEVNVIKREAHEDIFPRGKETVDLTKNFFLWTESG